MSDALLGGVDTGTSVMKTVALDLDGKHGVFPTVAERDRMAAWLATEADGYRTSDIA